MTDFTVPNDASRFGTRYKCDGCDGEFNAGESHNCTVTRKEFEALRADVKALALGLLSVHEKSWMMADVERRVRHIAEEK